MYSRVWHQTVTIISKDVLFFSQFIRRFIYTFPVEPVTVSLRFLLIGLN